MEHDAPTTKTCKTCGETKPIDNFTANKGSCKKCLNARNKLWREENEERLKAYREANKEKINARSKEWQKAHKDLCIERSKAWRAANKERDKANAQAYYQATKADINAKKRERTKSDPAFRLRMTVSSAIARALKIRGSSKNGKSCFQHLGYTIEQLQQHLEAQFEFWMTWDNQGKYNSKTWNANDPSTWTWQLDHIIPHSTFQYTSYDDEAFKQCWALSNLRPLAAKQNLLDGVTKARHPKIVA